MKRDTHNLKAEFGGAFVRAVANAAGFFVQEAARMMDADGVDFTIFGRGAGGTIRSPRLDVQLKTTSKAHDGERLAVDLELKHYDDLCDTDYQVPRVLVVVAVPADPTEWLSCDEGALVLRRCGYWRSLLGEPESANATTQRVHVNTRARFDVPALRSLMGAIAQGTYHG